MIISTTDNIPGKEISEVIGIVRGNSVRAKFIGKDIIASLRSLAGGEINEYKELLSETRERSMQRMINDAEELNADAIVCIRYETTSIGSGISELLVYGTAVKFK